MNPYTVEVRTLYDPVKRVVCRVECRYDITEISLINGQGSGIGDMTLRNLAVDAHKARCGHDHDDGVQIYDIGPVQ
jgi:hypothetical protein